MNNKKVLIITYYWPPAGGPGVQRWLKFAKYMPKFGFTPIILTVDPEKAEYPVKDFSLKKDINPGTKIVTTDCKSIYNLYKKFAKTKTAPYSGFANEGTPSLKQKISRFIRGNFFIPDPRKGWNKYAYQEAIKILESENIKIVITTGPPQSTHLIGQKLKKQLGIKWIADLRDPWTDIYYYDRLYPTTLARIIDKRFERKVIENCDQLITVSPDLVRLFQEKTATDISKKINVITNGYDKEDFSFAETPPSNNVFTITYTGTISLEYTIDSFIEAVSLFSKEKAIKVRFIGKVESGIKQQLERELGTIVEFISHVPHEDSIKYLLSSDALLLIISNVKNNKGIITGKIFEYLGTKKPVICIGPEDGDAAEIIRQCDAGFTIGYENVDRMKQLLRQLIEKKYSFRFQVERYERQEQTRMLCYIFDEISFK